MTLALKAKFDPIVHKLAAKVMMFPWEQKNSYGNWLAQTSYLVRHTTRLLALAAARLGTEHEFWHEMMLAGLKEEHGHDRLAQNDLTYLGYTLEQFPELAQTAAIYQSQYYRATYRDARSLCGYSLMLEGVASLIGRELSMRLIQAYGAQAASFLKIHGTQDQHHYEDGLAALATCSLATHQEILQNLHQSVVLYSSMLDASQQSFVSTFYGASYLSENDEEQASALDNDRPYQP